MSGFFRLDLRSSLRRSPVVPELPRGEGLGLAAWALALGGSGRTIHGRALDHRALLAQVHDLSHRLGRDALHHAHTALVDAALAHLELFLHHLE